MIKYNKYIFLKKYNNYDKIIENINNLNIKHFNISTIGKIEDDNMYLIHPSNFNDKLKSILIVASFHGDEIAPVHAIIKYLENFDYDILNKINISFIPVVNISGFKRNKRYNKWKEISNYGFLLKRQKLAKEGKILIENDELIKKLSKNGFLTMHEDPESDKGYLYVLSKNKKLPDIVFNIKSILEKDYGIPEDKKYKTKYDGVNTIKNGLVINHFDGTYENYLYENNIDICLTSETPMKNTDVEDRIKTNIKIIKEFIKSYI